jgi:hypothetical protein
MKRASTQAAPIPLSLFVNEGKSGDEVVKTIKSGGDEVLGIVTEEFQKGKHGKTSVLEFVQLELLHISSNCVLSEIEVSQETIVVGGANGEEDLHPSKSGDGVNGSNTVWYISEFEARGNFSREADEFGHNVSDHTQHADTSVLNFGHTVRIKGLLVNVTGKTKGICVVLMMGKLR